MERMAGCIEELKARVAVPSNPFSPSTKSLVFHRDFSVSGVAIPSAGSSATLVQVSGQAVSVDASFSPEGSHGSAFDSPKGRQPHVR